MSKLQYNRLSRGLQEQIIEDRTKGRLNSYRCDDDKCIRRNPNHDIPNLWRPAFIRDVEKIIHLPYYNRYTDKTQVFSFYNNDDISRRALHVQLVSRIARNIGSVLGLNVDLIEAIALGHDIGHTPFGHAGERYLSDILKSEIGQTFNHNVQSVRVLDRIFIRNISLQTLDGVLCHNGEFEKQEFIPVYDKNFAAFDEEVSSCYSEGYTAIEHLVPCTLEGCVVRLCDMIAYLGKDRQDAISANIIPADFTFSSSYIGRENAVIINNLSVDIIENSYGKDYIAMSKESFGDLKVAKKENYAYIYNSKDINTQYDLSIKPMFKDVFYRLLDDIRAQRFDSPVFTHHINYVCKAQKYYEGESYEKSDPISVVTDYIASMTDDYFIALHEKLFPNSQYRIDYISYFD